MSPLEQRRAALIRANNARTIKAAFKRVVAEQLAAKQGYDLSTCYMYGDSPGDLPVLESVGHPRVVNPIRGMARIARQRGWPILRWR